MPTPKVSVVVPIYNVEPYIERCARSLLEQTLPEIEYIFVNDCTPDASMEVLQRVLEDYPERKPWVRIINMPENSGQAKVREVGIKATTGEYVIHCDSDDWVDTDMYRAMYEKAIGEELDIVSCDFLMTNGVDINNRFSNALCDNENLLGALLSTRISPTLWTRLIRSDLVSPSKLIYPKGNMGEDLVLSLQYAFYAKRVGYVSKCFYHYCVRSTSISFADDIKDVLSRTAQMEANVKTIVAWMSKEGVLDIYSDELVRLKYTARMYILPALYQSPSKFISKWRSIFPEINSQYPFLSSVSLRYRLIFCLIFLGIHPYIRRVFKKSEGVKRVFE